MKTRLIDANALMKRIEEVYCKDCNSHNGVMCRACAHMDDMDFIEDATTVDAVPVKHGKWIVPPVDSDDRVYCSVCGWRPYGDLFANFCAGCGAKMNGDGTP